MQLGHKTSKINKRYIQGHKMRKHSMIKHIFVCLIILLSPLELADSTLITVEQNESLQAAIYGANPGDTILVNAGTYHENLYLNKSLILQGVGMPVIDGNGKDQVITLASGDSSLIGFIIKNSSKSSENDGGIIISSNNNTIKRNIVENSSSAIFLSNCSNNTMDSNKAIYNDYGIFLNVSYNNTIIQNNFLFNNKNGINLKSSESNAFMQNNASLNIRHGINIENPVLILLRIIILI